MSIAVGAFHSHSHPHSTRSILIQLSITLPRRLGTYRGWEVAIKHFSEWEEESFLEEARLLKRLAHANVVRYIGSCREPQMCVVTELAPLGDLMTLLSNTAQPLGWPLLLAIAEDIARAMLFMHDQGFVHRDLKSANVLVTSTNSADSVVAKVMGKSTRQPHSL